MRPLFHLCCLTVLSLLISGTSRASQNPRISLRVENATFAEAAAALSKAAGTSVKLYEFQFPPGLPKPPRHAPLDDRATFNWGNTTFANALRQLCEQYSLSALHTVAGYELIPAAGPNVTRLPAMFVGLTVKNGFKLFAAAIGINEQSSRHLRFLGGVGDNQSSGELFFALGCWIPEGDTSMIAGVENLVARDDLGTLLLANDSDMWSPGDTSPFGTLPDEWSRGFRMDRPHPKAKKLSWVTGDLVVHERMRAYHAEVPLPLAEEGLRVDVGSQTFVLSHYQVIPKPREDLQLPDGQPISGRLDQWGPQLRVRTIQPFGLNVRPRTGDGVGCAAVGASGRRYPAQQGGGSGQRIGPTMTWDTTFVFTGMEEPAVKLVWDVEERTAPKRVFSFRMTDIPLPPAAHPNLLVPRRTPPRQAIAAVPEREGPFYQSGGGILVSPVQILERPAGSGTLQLGLALKKGTGGGEVRWSDVPVNAEGLAELPDLQPGTYRVLRVYRPVEGLKTAEAGRWANAETEIVVTAGKKSLLPPLRWVLEGSGKVTPTIPKPRRR
ncbi:MAG TPA: hypothetical protein VK689_16750 [Armatimonadota bacterium]|nr:hypothetical protein [Armatimonadota bacterium]